MSVAQLHELIAEGESARVEFKSNKQVVAIVRELELIEKYGSGLRRVIDTFVACGLPGPEFEATQGGMPEAVFRTPAKTNDDKAIMGASAGVSALQHLIANQPGLRTPALAHAPETSPKNIERWLKQPKTQHLIEFQGATKTGGYHAAAKNQK